ncbi:hypothetical protein GOP47_0005311 [Adiantum capillus-veneris]|uniref:Kinetochore protein NDC80 n=1 Tax=Adiantum capillus-veneris TaxID=13818 RepID=A0A9D4V5K8_ADICA|nr:hypothetical protein GOP47_0005311 [Adiantum capillus-veneris]
MAGRAARPRNARPSIASAGRPSVSRRSSVTYSKAGAPRVDNRPINDKGFQIASMRKLVEYLSTHGYGFPIPPKLLPTGKDIHNMIEFLIHQIDPHFPLTRLEDDVPFFFRSIGYPFQISKSALYAAGSPHSWPNLLAALSWLVDTLLCAEAEINRREDQSFSIGNFIAQSYMYFLLGKDDACDALEEDIQKQFDEETQALQREAELTAKQIMELDSKLQGLKSGPSPLEALETKKSLLVTDLGKFHALIQNLNAHKSGLEKRVEQHNQQINSKEAELETITVENQDMARRVAQQTFSVEDYEKMTRERQRIEEDFQSATAWRKAKEKEIWDLEVLWAKKFKQLEELALDCKNARKRLKLPSQESSAGNSYEIQLNSRGETVEDLVGVNIKEHIRPHLLALQEEIEKNAREKWNESTELLKENTVLEDALKGKQAFNSQVEARTKELEASIKKKQETLECLQSEVKRVQSHIKEDEENVKTLERESAERHKRTNKECEQQEAAVEQELQQEAASLVALMEAESSLMEQIHARRNVVKARVADLKEMVSNNYVRKLKESG